MSTLPKLKRNEAFTLVELLIVISIIAILALLGLVIFRNVSSNARDGRKKADIEAITKAYEVKYSGSYPTLTGTDFSGGSFPQPPEGGSYYNNKTSDNSSFRVCTALEANPQKTCSSPSTNCYCLSSSQGSYPTGGGGGVPPDSPSSCDPNGTLTTGLVGYWRMNEGTGTTIGDSSSNNLNGSLNTASWVTGPSQCKLGYCVSDNGSSYSYVSYNPLLNITSNVSYNVWINITAQNTTTWPDILDRGTHIAYGFRLNRAATNVYFEYGITPCDGVSPHYTIMNISSNLVDSAWHMLTMTHDGSNIRVYLDGSQVGNPVTLTSFCSDTTYSLLLGNNLTGFVDDVRIYNRALALSEIQALYNGSSGCGS